MPDLVYPREKTLGLITLILGLIAWVLIVLLTLGTALIYLLFGFIFYLFAQSGLIAWLRGTGVRLSDEQFPELYLQYLQCCKKLGLVDPPEAYLLQGDGMMNAFATRFLGRNFVIVLSDTVDAMREQPDGINFYFGHELGHIKQGHLTGHFWRMPVLWLPWIGAAYSRAQEYTCDMHGRACCDNPESAARALTVLAAGAEKWKSINLLQYARQTMANRGFFPDLHELLSGYPWLTKRVARMISPGTKMPGRNWFSYLFALFVPYGGRAGGALVGIMMVAAIIGVAAAIAVPAMKGGKSGGGLTELLMQGMQQGKGKAAFEKQWKEAEPVRDALARYYKKNETVPDSLAQAGVSAQQATGLSYDSDDMSLTARTSMGALVMSPMESEDGEVVWHCMADGPAEKYLPDSCKDE